LRQDYAEFTSRNAEIIAIGTDSADRFRKHWERESIPFPGVPDPGKQLVKSLGQEFKLLKFGRMPAVMIVGSDGRVHHAHYGDSAADIPDNSKLLAILDERNRSEH
jgi:mycoredoxin-dependent peroxiredoxin